MGQKVVRLRCRPVQHRFRNKLKINLVVVVVIITIIVIIINYYIYCTLIFCARHHGNF